MTRMLHDRREPLAGPSRDLDPWIFTYGSVEGWVLDMCDRRELPDWARDVPARPERSPRPRLLPALRRLMLRQPA